MFNSFSINFCNLWAHSEHKSASWMNISSLPPTEPPSHLSILKSNLALRKYDGCISLPHASHIIVTFSYFITKKITFPLYTFNSSLMLSMTSPSVNVSSRMIDLIWLESHDVPFSKPRAIISLISETPFGTPFVPNESITDSAYPYPA